MPSSQRWRSKPILDYLALVSLAVLRAEASSKSSGPAQSYKQCQRSTAHPLDGCPVGTVFVARDDPRADFTSIQAAIGFLGNTTEPAYVLVAPGNYTEQLNVTRSSPLTLLGISNQPWEGEEYAAGGAAPSNTGTATTPQNRVQVWWNSANHESSFSDNVYTGVLTVGPTLNATLTGSGPTGFPVPKDTPFGCSDFRAYNIDFRNEYAPYASGPAHALGVSRANAGFYSCGFYSYQDTVYVGKLGNAYFYDSVIAGQTDFLYGFGTAYIEKSILSLRSCGGGITAWKGSNTTYSESQKKGTGITSNKYGVYISNSRVLATNASVAAETVGKCALGRPWNSQHRSVFMASYLGPSIKPEGYVVWSRSDPRVDKGTTIMASWRNYGPGFDETAQRGSGVSVVMDDEAVEPYRYPADVFLDTDGEPGNIKWIDDSVLFKG